MATLTSLPGEIIDIIIDHLVTSIPRTNPKAPNYASIGSNGLAIDDGKLINFATYSLPTISYTNAGGLLLANHYLNSRTSAALSRFSATWDNKNVIYILADEENKHLGIHWLLRNPDSDIIHYNIHTARLPSTEEYEVIPELESLIDGWIVGTRAYCEGDVSSDHPWSSTWNEVTLNFTYENASDKGIGQKTNGRIGKFDDSSTWRDTCWKMLNYERNWEWGPRYDGCPSWLEGMADSWKIKNFEVRDEGKFVFSCDMFATLDEWDDEMYSWKYDHPDASNVGNWGPVGGLVCVECDEK